MKKITTDTGTVLDFEALPSHARLTFPVTILKGKNPRPVRHITLGALINEIRTMDIHKLNDSKSMVCEYETYLKNVELGIEKPKNAYEAKKDLLNGFLMGNYSYRMDEKEKCLEYVPCLVLDLDACSSTYQRFLIQTKLQELDYVFAAFPSPSGYGLRVLVWTDATYETHRNIYQKIVEELCVFLSVTTNKGDGTHFDATCKNESRHFYYVAVDKNNFYLNLNSAIFKNERVQKPTIIEKKDIISPVLPKKQDNNDIYTYIDAINDDVKIEFIFKSINMNKPRKLQCFDFGCLCKENNVDFDAARRTAIHQFYDSEQKNPEKIIEAQLRDGYNYSQVRYDDAQFIAFLRNTHNVTVKTNKSALRLMPTNPLIEKKELKLDLETKYPSAAFYTHLPTILRQCTDVLTHEMDKHVFLWGALPAISSICCDVSGIYDKKKVFASYYTYIVATGGAGKGALDYARQLVLDVAQKIQAENEKKTLFVPTNIGNTQLVQKLQENGGRGLFFETEGGIVAKMAKSENMDLSDTFRKGFHHEALLLGRKMDKLDINLQQLRLSIVISGTFSQLLPTIKDGEDGLLSRFNYLYLTGNYEFKNVFDRHNNEKVMGIFADTSQKMVLLYELLQKRSVSFEFTETQERYFLAVFKEHKVYMMNSLSDRGEVAKEIFSGVMNRIGLMCFRAAMILTVLRYFEEGSLGKKDEKNDVVLLICNEIDFKTALEFAELSRNNAFAVFNRLQKGRESLEGNFLAKTERLDKAIELKNQGYSHSEIAKLLLGDENKKSTVTKWFNK